MITQVGLPASAGWDGLASRSGGKDGWMGCLLDGGESSGYNTQPRSPWVGLENSVGRWGTAHYQQVLTALPPTCSPSPWLPGCSAGASALPSPPPFLRTRYNVLLFLIRMFDWKWPHIFSRRPRGANQEEAMHTVGSRGRHGHRGQASLS